MECACVCVCVCVCQPGMMISGKAHLASHGGGAVHQVGEVLPDLMDVPRQQLQSHPQACRTPQVTSQYTLQACRTPQVTSQYTQPQ